MKKYESPEMEIILLEDLDIITISGKGYDDESGTKQNTDDF